MSAGWCNFGKLFCSKSGPRRQGAGHSSTHAFALMRRHAWVAIVLLIAGCGDERPRRVAVSGTVLIDGKPLTYGDLKFVPEGARPSYGKLDSNGHFTLSCYDGN